MDSQLITILTTTITTTIGAIISGIFGIIGAQFQAQTKKPVTTTHPKILLPPGVIIPSPNRESRKYLRIFILFVVGSAILGTIIGAILQRSQPMGNSSSRDSLLRLTYVMIAVLVIGVVVFGAVLSRHQALGNRKWSLAIAVSITMALVLTGSAFMLSSFLAERTVYFLVDASAGSRDASQEIFARVKLNLEQIPDNVDVGLAIFGGGIGSGTGCNDITEIVKPAPKHQSVPQIERAVSQLLQITPSGDAALQNAIIFALSHLANRRGVQQIFVVTASTDSVCSAPDRAFLDNIADQSQVQFEIIIVHVGDISEADSRVFTDYSDRFLNVAKAEDLSDTIQDVLFTPPSLYNIYKQVYPSSGQ